MRHPLKDCFIQHCKLHEMEQWGNACTAGDPYHNMGMHSCASTNHFYESSLLQTTRYVEFQGTGVGDGLRMYLGLWLGCTLQGLLVYLACACVHRHVYLNVYQILVCVPGFCSFVIMLKLMPNNVSHAKQILVFQYSCPTKCSTLFEVVCADAPQLQPESQSILKLVQLHHSHTPQLQPVTVNT